MPRKKISEFKAKQLIFPVLAKYCDEYKGIRTNAQLNELKNKLDASSNSKTNSKTNSKKYVVKVDQGVKKRGKLGLIAMNVASKDVSSEIKKLANKGYSSFLVEEFFPHKADEEMYLALTRTRLGIEIMFSPKGGVDVESSHASTALQRVIVDTDKLEDASGGLRQLPVPYEAIIALIEACNMYHISFLEINPLVVRNNRLYILDLAVEVDSAGAYFTHEAWDSEDFADAKSSTPEETAVEQLSLTSPASFKLHILNPNGSIFMLLSGGGASLVLADEYHNHGYGSHIANYGEYSGAPTTDETYEYARHILSALLKSTAREKVLLIAGGVANFTDISITFRGIVRALSEVVEQLKKQKISIYVRRGGPNQMAGLQLMREFLQTHKIHGDVYGPEVSLPKIVTISLQEANNITSSHV